MAKLPDALYCLICEHVRPEPNRKFTLLGFYGMSPHAKLVLPAFPAGMPLGVGIACKESPVNGVTTLELEVTGPSNTEIVKRQELPFGVGKLIAGKDSICIFNFAQLLLPQAGVYTLRIWSDRMFHSEHKFTVLLGNFDVNGNLIES